MAAQYGLAPVTTPSGEDDNANQAPRILGVSILLMVVPTVVVFLRFVARILSRAGLWWDDWIVLVALLLTLTLSALQVYSISIGFGEHMAAQGDILHRIDIAEYWFKLFYAYESVYDFCTYLAKLSILLFYSRIFKERRFLFWLRLTIIFATLHFVAGELVVIMECIPVQALWDPTVNGVCVNLITFIVAHGAITVLIDFAILVLPLPMIWSLEIERSHKIALSSVFLLGGLVVVAAIIRVVVISELVIEDITWVFVNAALWTAAEPAIAVTSASLPILRSLWIWNRRKNPDRYGNETPDSYDETKTAPPVRRQAAAALVPGIRKHQSNDSQQFPLNSLPAGVQQVPFGNRVTVASGGQARKLSDETDPYADLPIMHPQEAALASRSREHPHISQQHAYPGAPPQFDYRQHRSHRGPPALPSNRSELYG